MSRLSVLAVENPEVLSRPGGVTSVLQAQLREMAPRFAQPDERGAQMGAVMLQLNYDNRFEDALAVGREYLAYQKAHAAPGGAGDPHLQHAGPNAVPTQALRRMRGAFGAPA